MTKHVLPLGETRAAAVCYNHAAKLVVAEFIRRDAERSVSSLYIRDGADGEYRRLVPPDGFISYRGAVSVRSEPLVYFNVFQIAEGGGGRWLHVARANVLTHEVEVVLGQEELDALTRYEPRYRIKPWVSDLASASDDGTTLTCRLGVPDPPQPDGSVRMRYSFFDFHLGERRLSLLASLESPGW